jgi:hypothetical protein
MSQAKVQHFVPQLLLRLHLNDPSAAKGSERVWCFDKLTDNIFSPNIKGILAESRYYEIEIEGAVYSLEPSLAELEDRTAPILKRLIQSRALAEIAVDELMILAAFCAVQIVRTPTSRDRIKDVSEVVGDALRKRGIDPDKIPNFKIPSQQEIKDLSLNMLAEAPTKYAPYFLDKHWYLIDGHVDDPFHLGDHPVVLDNDFIRGVPGGLGLASPGVCIYLPLCPTLCLCMVDPAAIAGLFAAERKLISGYEELEAQRLVRRLTSQHFTILEELRQNCDRVSRMLEPFKSGTPTAYDPRTVMRVNSLQMTYATRWIVSSKQDFSLPKKMISDDQGFRKGPTVGIG